MTAFTVTNNLSKKMETSTENPNTVVTVERVIAYAAYENKMQENVYPGRIKAGKIKPDVARLNYKIVRDFGRLAAKMQEKGYGWEDLQLMIECLPQKSHQKP